MQRGVQIFERVGAGLSLLAMVLVAGSWGLSYLKPLGWIRCDYSTTGNEFRMLHFHSGHGLIAGAWQRYLLGSQIPEIFEDETNEVQIRFTGGGGLRYPRGWQRVPEDATVNPKNQNDAEHWWERMGVRVRFSSATVFLVPVSTSVVIVPHWVLLLLLSVYPGFLLLTRRMRKKRIGEWKCGDCGYDLRASPERCPECGAENSGLGSRNFVGVSKVSS